MTAPADSASAGLPRRLGFWAGFYAVVASMVGSGILSTSGFLLRDLGDPWTMLGLWLAGGMLATAGALTVSELATGYSEAGGDYVYVREAFGPMWAFVYGWATLIVGFAAPTAASATLAASYLSAPWKDQLAQIPVLAWLGPDGVVAWLAAGIVVVFTFWHCLGHAESFWVQAATTAAKMATLAGFAVAALASGQGDWSRFAVVPAPPDPTSLAGPLVYVIYSYIGWTGAIYLAGEIREPGRLLPRCVLAGCAAVVALYLLVNVAYAYAVDGASLRGLPDSEVAPILQLAAGRLFGPQVAGPLSVLLGLGLLATVSVYIWTGPRVYYAMARDGLFLRYAGQLDTVRGVPTPATLTQGAATLAVLASGRFDDMVKFATVGLMAMAILVTATIFRLRPRMAPGGFRMPGYPLPPLLVVAGLAGIIAYFAYREPGLSLASLGSILLGIPLYLWMIASVGRRAG